MDLTVVKREKTSATKLRITLKVRDEFAAALLDEKGQIICEQEDGYVPEFMPGQHYGDYVLFDVDITTGQVTNWVARPDLVQKWVDACLGEGDGE